MVLVWLIGFVGGFLAMRYLGVNAMVMNLASGGTLDKFLGLSKEPVVTPKKKSTSKFARSDRAFAYYGQYN